jgi:hypothetical protein
MSFCCSDIYSLVFGVFCRAYEQHEAALRARVNDVKASKPKEYASSLDQYIEAGTVSEQAQTRLALEV